LAGFADLASAKVNDEIIILLIGHGTFDGKMAFNLRPDLAAPELRQLLEKFPTQRIAFIHTGSASAFRACPRRTARIVAATHRRRAQRDAFPEHFVQAGQHEAAIATAASRSSKRSSSNRVAAS
jgi:hypothetical protein